MVQGHVKAKGYLGSLYYHGDGVAKDELKAFKFISEAADLGDSFAQTCMSDFLLKKSDTKDSYGDSTRLVPYDPERGLKMLKIAAKKGEPDAQVKLSFLYTFGDVYVFQSSPLLFLFFEECAYPF